LRLLSILFSSLVCFSQRQDANHLWPANSNR
jgi:hypothetical protein